MSDTIAKLRDLLLNSSKAGRLRDLLDSIYGAASTGAEAYGSASSPMSAEHSGLLGGLLMDMSPLGDAKSAYDGVQSARDGDYIGAGLGALGALPMVPNLAGTFIGKGAKTWDAVNASRAIDMEKAGIDPRKIWSETGNWRGPDGHWRQEIPDNTFDLIQQKGTPLEYMQDRVAEYPQSMRQSVMHPTLFTAYPDISGANARLTTSSIGGHTPPQHGMPETFDLPFKHTVDGDFTNRAKQKSSAIHELQHGVQSREGFARGGSPDEFRGKSADYNYKRLAGEAESRATQARMNMDAEQRRKLFPADSYDVPLGRLLFRK